MGEGIVVRHCAASGQEAAAPLSEAGYLQAGALADHLTGLGIVRIVSSPYRRALETAAPFAARSGIEIEHEERLVERRLSVEARGDWLAQLEQTWQDFDYRAPGGETSREAQVRGRAAFDEIVGSSAGPVLLVSHGNLIALLLHSFDPELGFDDWRALSNPDVFRIDPHVEGGSAIARTWRG